MKPDEMFRSVCNDVETVTGIKTVLFDAERRIVYAHPGSMCAFCAAVRQIEGMERKCHACDKDGCDGCPDGEEIHVYRCHMGLVEAVAPIIENGITVGYLMFGQILPEGGRDAVVREIGKVADREARETLLRYLDEMQETSYEKIHAAARILAMCASYVRLKELVRAPKETQAYRVGQYVSEHLSDESLSVDRICKALGISRTSLYGVCKAAFGVGVGDYIRNQRIEHAVRLIRSTTLSFDAIAERTGIPSADYLAKLVKRRTGKSPRILRREWNGG